MSKQIAVVGQGYVGLPLAIAAAEAGFSVVGIDINRDLVKALSAGTSPVGDISDAEIAHAIARGTYCASTDFSLIADCEIAVICVPTPLDSEHRPDLSALESAVHSVATHLSEGSLLIVESTIAPGTTREVVAQIVGSDKNIEIAYSPERIDPSNKQWNIRNTPKLVAGLTPSATDRTVDFYSAFINRVDRGESVEVIEVAKLLENSFRLINISFINEIAIFCQKLGVDVRDVIKAASTKPYGFMPFFPSAGVGGHCIPVDPSYLSAKAHEIGAPSRFIDLANDVNRSMPTFFAGIALGKLGTLAAKKILVVGIAYKPNVSDMRESPAVELIAELRSRGAEVSWHDDLVGTWAGESSTPLTADYDLVIFVNPHPGTDISLLGTAHVLDTRGGY